MLVDYESFALSIVSLDLDFLVLYWIDQQCWGIFLQTLLQRHVTILKIGIHKEKLIIICFLQAFSKFIVLSQLLLSKVVEARLVLHVNSSCNGFGLVQSVVVQLNPLSENLCLSPADVGLAHCGPEVVSQLGRQISFFFFFLLVLHVNLQSN